MSFADYVTRAAAAGPTNNLAALVGHGTLRLCANGTRRDLADGALDVMQDLAEQAMAAGAAGVSSGLIYVPGTYSDVDDLIAVAAGCEAVEIGRRAGCRVQISHCTVSGTGNWGRADDLLDVIRRARLEGVDVRGDQYPYMAGSTFLAARLPPDALEGGFERVRAAAEDSAALAERQASFAPSSLWEPPRRADRRPRQRVGGRAHARGGGGRARCRRHAGTLRAGPGARVINDCRVERLVVGEGGRIVGVAAQRDNTPFFALARRGVVLSTGGFIMDKAMVARHAPQLLECNYPVATDTDDGSGIRMGMAVGAEAANMSEGLVLNAYYPPSSHLKGVFVDGRGRRFVNEDAYLGRTSAAILDKADGRAFLILEDERHGRTQAFHKVAAVEETFDALGDALGLPPGALTATMEAYNRRPRGRTRCSTRTPSGCSPWSTRRTGPSTARRPAPSSGCSPSAACR